MSCKIRVLNTSISYALYTVSLFNLFIGPEGKWFAWLTGQETEILPGAPERPRPALLMKSRFYQGNTWLSRQHSSKINILPLLIDALAALKR